MSEMLLTTPEVAKLLRVDPETVRRLVARGELPCVKLSAQIIRYHPEALRRRFGLSDCDAPFGVGSVRTAEKDI